MDIFEYDDPLLKSESLAIRIMSKISGGRRPLFTAPCEPRAKPCGWRQPARSEQQPCKQTFALRTRCVEHMTKTPISLVRMLKQTECVAWLQILSITMHNLLHNVYRMYRNRRNWGRLHVLIFVPTNVVPSEDCWGSAFPPTREPAAWNGHAWQARSTTAWCPKIHWFHHHVPHWNHTKGPIWVGPKIGKNTSEIPRSQNVVTLMKKQMWKMMIFPWINHG